MIRLTKSQVLLIHDQLIAETGGSSGLRDEGILDSALSAPFQTFGGEDVYPSLQQKAARLCFGLVKNHPFVDGNKRIGAHVMLVFLALNGVELQHSQTELSDVILQLAAGEINAGFFHIRFKSHSSVGGFCHATGHHALHGSLHDTKNKGTSGSHRCGHRLLPAA